MRMKEFMESGIDRLLLSEGKSIENISDMIEPLKAVIQKHNKYGGEVVVFLGKGIQDGNLLIRSTLLPKEKWTNGIRDNDPAFFGFAIRDFDDDGSINRPLTVSCGSRKPRLLIKASPGVNLVYESVKIPWRDGKATPEQIVNKFDKFYGEVQRIVAENKDRINGIGSDKTESFMKMSDLIESIEMNEGKEPSVDSFGKEISRICDMLFSFDDDAKNGFLDVSRHKVVNALLGVTSRSNVNKIMDAIDDTPISELKRIHSGPDYLLAKFISKAIA